MAGYIFSLDSLEALSESIENGVYGTVMSPPKKNGWLQHHEGTFGDYCTMKAGDNVYFFIERNIYGIGTFVDIEYDCKFNNYPQSSYPQNFRYDDIKEEILYDICNISENIRWICTFKPSPFFFKCGVDTDDILTSNPNKFKVLRTFWKRSFIKIDDEENKALKDIILKRNEEYIFNNDSNTAFEFNDKMHRLIENKLQDGRYYFDIKPIAESCIKDNKIRHEMSLEAGILHQISNKVKGTINIFGHWDYLSHQVPASPFKPIDYMDKMDVFGYRYIYGFDTISKYLLMELKKDAATGENIEQTMKYVDWIREEYAFGDYSMIEAFLVAEDFSDDVIEYAKGIAERNYIIGRRPIHSRKWTNLKLVRYAYDIDLGKFVFSLVE